ncbi:MAG TPA: transporter substrate-binding domain-containing protein [Casimicrobiaceae bacterium]|jgi:cystine transport system substrate-binding protein
MNIRKLLVAASAVLALAAPGVTFGADLLDAVKQRGTLRIGLEGTYPPFNFRDERGELTGYDVDIAKAIAQKMGVKPEFVTVEWSGLLGGLQAGKYDVIVNQVAATDKRREVFDFSDPYVMSAAQLIVRADDDRPWNSLRDLEGKTVGVSQGSNYAELARSVDGAKVRIYPGAQEYLQDLAQGRIDVALNDSLLVPYLKQKTKLPIKGAAFVGKVEQNAIPFPKGNPKFKAAIDKALADMKADGTFQRISEQWFGRDVSKPPKVHS